jgi:general secretion pathway protein C
MAFILQIKTRQFFLRYAPALPLLVLIIILAAQLAHWTWVFFLPGQEVSTLNTVQTDAESAARIITAEHLFGSSAQAGGPVSNDNASLNIRLTGVFAANRRADSYAIINTGTKTDQTVRVGDEIQPGVKLKAVHPQYIIVNHDGVPKRIKLEQKGQELSLIQSGAAGLGIKPLGYNAYSVSRNNLTVALQNGNSNIRLGQLTSASGGGMLVTDASNGSLAEKLGLQTGDLLRNINGQPVSSMADLSSIYQRFKQASQVQLDIMRSGKLIQLSYTVQQ